MAIAAQAEKKEPTRVQCATCGHKWVGFYLPLPISDAVRVMKNLTCPMCAAGAKNILVFDGRAVSGT